ncbi:MAG TPA: rhomboid family intramembrane serine protease [Candidatus Binatia bacterium]|jgi:membrane associated rhomboid family serine protease|nr:rhomboid family intramembrane serine protease [Candidatus Binatia bacterium]
MIPLRDSIPSRSWPVVTYLLIGLNVWVFLYELALGPDLEAVIQAWGFVPADYFALARVPGAEVDRYLPLLSSMFLHGGWLHLIGNMMYLWIFGDNVEDRIGHLRYLLFYLLAGLGAALVHAHLHPQSAVPTIGASGAISGVLGGYLLLFPHARVLTLVPIVFIFVQIVEVPAVIYLGFWFLIQLVAGTLAFALADAAGGVAWWAHVGGFTVGLILVPLLLRRRSYPRAWRTEVGPW